LSFLRLGARLVPHIRGAIESALHVIVF
jgi:hypothetical protein